MTGAQFSVDLSVEQWTALLRLVEDNCESLKDWDEDTQTFWEDILNKLREGPLA